MMSFRNPLAFPSDVQPETARALLDAFRDSSHSSTSCVSIRVVLPIT
jgi:hypothetical protein